MKRSILVLPLLLAHALASGAGGPDPRFAAAAREAEVRLAAAQSSDAKDPAAAARLASLRAWRDALRVSAVRATPADTLTLVTASRGSAWLLRGGQRLPPRETALLREGDGLFTGPDGRVELRFEDGSRLVAAPSCELSFARLPRPGAPATTLRLSSGRVYWEVGTQLQGRAELQAGAASARLASGAVEAAALADGRLELRGVDGTTELRARAVPSADAWWDSGNP
ncbi:MAG: FecR domain-containing protein [Elusimicrobiota bacterium]|jgi:hypothetical protein